MPCTVITDDMVEVSATSLLRYTPSLAAVVDMAATPLVMAEDTSSPADTLAEDKDIPMFALYRT